MEVSEKNLKEYYTIDLIHIFKTVWKRVWVIILSGFLAALIGFFCSAFIIPPKYSSEIMLYVNNSSFSLGNTSFSISSSEITAAQSLVKTYIVMLKNRTTLEQVIEKTGVDYKYEELYDMIEAESVNETEVLKVTVTSEDPYEAQKIANCIAEVLPNRISEIIEGSSMEVVDRAVPDPQKESPSITNYTAIGFILGLLISTLIVAVIAMLDDTIHDEEYILKSYEFPILAKIPDLLNSSNREYGYYSQRKSTNK